MLGTAVGANTLTATDSAGTVTFHATGLVDAAASVVANAGEGQSATVNTNVATAPSVLVSDQFGNPVSGVAVTFAVASGGGSATGTSAITNASGLATVASWKLGTGAGANTLTASSSAGTVTFHATGGLAQAVLDARSLEEANEALHELGVRTELDLEREFAAR